MPADVPIVGDARLVLEQMLELLEQEEAQQPLDDIRDWWQQIEQWRARHCLRYDDQSDKIKPQAVIETIWRLTQAMPTSLPMWVSIRCSPPCITPSINRGAGLTPVVSAPWALAYRLRWGSKWLCRTKWWSA